ncbi:MAG: hypothetical protein ACLP50_37475 [Solirubrobacteraceae bacterium]
MHPNGCFYLFIDPHHAGAGQIDRMLDVVQAHATDAEAAGDPPVALYTYGLDTERSATDRTVGERLEQRGFVASPNPSGGILAMSIEDISDPSLPPGYELRDLSDTTLLGGRVEAERAHSRPRS